MPYISNTDEDRQQMLNVIGVERFEELIRVIPPELRLKEPLPLGDTLPDSRVEQMFNTMAGKNRLPDPARTFLGGGAYLNYIPALVQSLIGRSEFYTAYTPYQAEVSQGTLQSIYEFQSLICRLTDMEIANASMYEGGTAVLEACNMCVEVTRRRAVLVAESVHPSYLQILHTYYHALDIEIVMAPLDGDRLNLNRIREMVDERFAALVVQSPNYFGSLEEQRELVEIAHAKGMKYISVYDPVSLGIMETPGEVGADVAVAEGQALSVPVSWGGPWLGFFATRKEFLRKMPGRIIGATEDMDGKPAYVMTHVTREQHIRREKATSNICTNQGLVALASAIYMSLIGETGLKSLASDLYTKAQYLSAKLADIEGLTIWNQNPFYREFVLELPGDAGRLVKRLQSMEWHPGIVLSDFGMTRHLLVSVHELHTRNDLDMLVEVINNHVREES